MNPAFDHIAHSYDREFTHASIGRAQRELVWQFVQQEVTPISDIKVLEVNCGTGEDAQIFSELGAKVIATDISPEMIQVASEKNKAYQHAQFEVVDINSIQHWRKGEKFDLIFSNFGGLNCLSPKELKTFIHDAKEKLNDNGKLVLVIMPKYCVWEMVYFTGKLRFKSAFRRLRKKGVSAQLDGDTLWTYYYNPRDIIKASVDYQLKRIAPIGLFVPPSYLQPFFQKRSRTLQKLIKEDQKQIQSDLFSSFSDHFAICLQKK